MLPAGATIGRHYHLVGEDDLEFAVVSGDLVGAKQRALSVNGHRQPVRVIGAVIKGELVSHAQDETIAGEGPFYIM